MPSLDVVVQTPLTDSFRVQQVAGMFDVPVQDRLSQQFQVELPDASEPWQVGLIVGPSGSGKSTVARQAFGEALFAGADWSAERAVVDGFGELPVREVVELLTAVGLSSPPSWIKPYAVLSNGEQFRCDLARALAGSDQLVVFDEFTSVVDRKVARVCSAAVAKAVRRRDKGRFIGVSCHYDIADWLEPDWVLDMATGQLQRRRLRRPTIELEVHRCHLDAWRLFAKHHYLSGTLAPQARGYLATWEGEPVCFCATLPTIAQRGRRRFTRIVTLPDYQGIGIGMRVVAAVADLHREEGYRVNVTSSHPALIEHCKRSQAWRTTAVKKLGQSRSTRTAFTKYRNSAGRAVVSFEYLGDQQQQEDHASTHQG